MGWKTSIVIASQTEQPSLAHNACHDADFANQVAAKHPGGFTFAGESTFEEGAYPRNGNLFIGAYDNALVIGHLEWPGACFKGGVPPLISEIDAILPRCTILALELHSVVNFYGYALFQNNALIRGRAGSADDGILLDVGEPRPEEKPLFERSAINSDGERVWREEFDGVVEEMDHSSMGEEFVFEVSRRFLGERFDSFDHDELAMSEFRPTPKSFWQRMRGK